MPLFISFLNEKLIPKKYLVILWLYLILIYETTIVNITITRTFKLKIIKRKNKPALSLSHSLKNLPSPVWG